MNHLFNAIIFICLFLLSPVILAQNLPIFEEKFESLEKDRLTNGVVGSAINLTAEASDRTVLRYDIDHSKWKESFTLMAWVWAEADYEEYKIMDLVVNYADSTHLKWQLLKQVNNAWASEIQGKDAKLAYKPGFKRQLITKGWNLLSLSFNAQKEEIAFYYNDLQVAIYSIEDFIPESPASQISIQIGGDQKGELGEWETFNGSIDDIKLYNSSWTRAEVKDYYRQFKLPEIEEHNSKSIDTLRIMSYNIWHGGNETGKGIGYLRIADLIKQSKADIIAIQETYGSGAKIADELGFYFYLRSSNISIISRYPIAETLPAYKSFHHASASILIGDKSIVFNSIWLNYPIDYWGKIDRGEKIEIEKWEIAQYGNKKTLEGIIDSLKPALGNSKNAPVIIAGDFNSGSHLDWIPATQHMNAGYVMPFPTSQYLETLGFRDSFREFSPNLLKNRGLTWTPANPATFQDRIDYIYIKNKSVKIVNSYIIDHHPIRYPSDHASLITTILLPK